MEDKEIVGLHCNSIATEVYNNYQMNVSA